MNKLIALFACLLGSALPARMASQGVSQKVTPARTTASPLNPPAVGAVLILSNNAELGAQVSAAIDNNTSGRIWINLAPNSRYAWTTPVTNARPGVLLDCHGSTISASYAGAQMEWRNANWALQGIDAYAQPPTGIQNCKFSFPSSTTTAYVGLVSRTANFVARNISVVHGGGFRLQGESLLAQFDGVRIVDPTTTPVMDMTGGGGTFGPNGVVFNSGWCEGVSGGFSGTCFEVDAGTLIVSHSYIESFGTGFRVNGGSLTVDHSDVNERAQASTAFLLDSGCGTLTLDGIRSQMVSDGSHDPDIWFQNNCSSAPVITRAKISNVDIWANAPRGATTTIFRTTQPLMLSLGGANKITIGNYNTSTLFSASGSGVFQYSNITGIDLEAYFTATLTGSAGRGDVFRNSTIAGNTFLRPGIWGGLGEGTSFSDNNITAGGAYTFTGVGNFSGNTFASGTPAVTLDGSLCHGNLNYNCAEQFRGGIGLGSNNGYAATIFDANGVRHESGATPTASAGTPTGTNATGSVSGLSGASSVTITFAHGGWSSWSSCTASTSTGTTAYPSAISASAVTFTFSSSFTGTLYYNCGGK